MVGGDREGDWVEGIGHLQDPSCHWGLVPVGRKSSSRSLRLPEGHGAGWASQEPFLVG